MKLTLEQFNHITNIDKKPKELRLGQFMMNQLYKISPNLYSFIIDTEFDPFFDDRHIPDFLKTLSDHVLIYPELIRQKTPTTCGQCVVAMLYSVNVETAIHLIGHENITSDVDMLSVLHSKEFEIGAPKLGSIAVQKHKDPRGDREHWTLFWHDKIFDPAEIGPKLWPVYKHIVIVGDTK
jgi:hypothetical protein